MKAFAPYAIHHLQIAEAVHWLSPAQNGYVVLWWQKVPLGHVWFPVAESISWPAQILNAIQPAVAHYLNQSINAANWQAAFLKGDTEPLYQQLQHSSALQSFSKPHAAEKLSVVICTRNRTKALAHCINALLQSSDQHFELVIVDNAPDDDSTKNLVATIPQAKYVREPRKGLDIARNTGAQAASCAIVAYTDDDVTVDADWVKNVKSCFADAETMCVTGLVIPLELQTISQYKFETLWGFNKGYVPLVFDAAYFKKNLDAGVPVWDIGAGANMAFRKSLFQQIGYFDERLDVGAAGCSGDSEMWYRALAEGFTCRYFPHLFVYHQHRASVAELKHQIFYYMRGQVASLLIQNERYKHKGNLNYLYRVLPRWYATRLRNRLRGRRRANADTLVTEIRGCISGWRFYRANRR